MRDDSSHQFYTFGNSDSASEKVFFSLFVGHKRNENVMKSTESCWKPTSMQTYEFHKEQPRVQT
jgi:hypothetical protein